jgi:hypothetical protein
MFLLQLFSGPYGNLEMRCVFREKMDWCEGADRPLCKDGKELIAAAKTRRCVGAGHMGGEVGNGTSKTTKSALGFRLTDVKRHRSF